MKHIAYVWVLPLTLATLPVAAQEARAIPDKNLEAALRHYVFEKRGTDKEVTVEDLAKIFVLDAKGKGIKDLTGLDKCTNLLEIKLAKNEITDITPLKALGNLQSLDLSNNKIGDLSALAGLTGLQYIELSNNQVTSVEPLAKLSKLSALYIAGNKISDVSPLGELAKLSSLDLAKNELSDIKPLGKLSGLSLLKLDDNRIEDITPLPKKNEYKLLLLERNKITDLSHLVEAAKADAEGEKRFAPFLRLFLDGNPLSDTAKSQQIPGLKQYGVRVDLGEYKASRAAAKAEPK